MTEAQAKLIGRSLGNTANTLLIAGALFGLGWSPFGFWRTAAAVALALWATRLIGNAWRYEVKP